MYYTNIKDYEQLVNQRKNYSYKNGVVLAIVICLITALLI